MKNKTAGDFSFFWVWFWKAGSHVASCETSAIATRQLRLSAGIDEVHRSIFRSVDWGRFFEGSLFFLAGFKKDMGNTGKLPVFGWFQEGQGQSWTSTRFLAPTHQAKPPTTYPLLQTHFFHSMMATSTEKGYIPGIDLNTGS